ncbi:hypothetical protein ACFL55_01685 [Candidatus Latescibacterota bacterium]
MIISERWDKQKTDFEELLKETNTSIEKSASRDPDYFLRRSATEFEVDVFDAMCEEAKGTDFDRSIHLISGHRFPDIVINKYFGVEVKTTKQNYWKSTGNSVLESTRVEDVKRIYVYFAQLSLPLKFKYRLYQECLYDIAVTHSPRYLINMELKEGDSIFDKIGLTYDELRSLEDPIKPIVAYYRSIARSGEEPWWMDSGESMEKVVNPTVRLWRNLPEEEKINLKNQAMARFPEIFGRNNTKYYNLASWLAARHGIVNPSLRDIFTASGRINIELNGHIYEDLPHIFFHLNNITEVLEQVKQIPKDEAKHHWHMQFDLNDEQKVGLWANKIIEYASQLLDSNQFIIHLLGLNIPRDDWPDTLKSGMERYGLG